MIPNGGTFGGRHTRDYFGMYPTSKLTFSPSIPATKYVEVPGMSGKLDYTQVLTGQISHKNRTGTINFMLLTGVTYPTTYSLCQQHFDGKEMNVILDDDPSFFWKGRFWLNTWKSEEGRSIIAIDYDIDPYKYPIDHSLSHDWLWNDLFDNVIYYGIFDVSGSVARNLINPSGSSITPKFTCSSAMTVTKGGSTYSLPAGTTTSPGFSLSPGDNQMTFTGTGRVEVDYALGSKEL